MKNALINSKKLFIFDMDGTIYLGDTPFDFAVKYINLLRESGKKILFFTNNASKDADTYLKKLTRLGYNPSRSEIMTAGDVTLEFLRTKRSGKSVFMLATPLLCEQYAKAGINLVGPCEEKCDIVISSFDMTLTYEKADAACRYIRNGAEFLCTHPDFNCPTENGFLLDSGSIAAMITASTGVLPTYFGKPYEPTIEMICSATGFSRDEMCVFGDRLNTDIALGKRHGVLSILVLSGATSKKDLENCPKDIYPDIVLNSLADLL